MFRFKVETRYNLPSSRDEICMFELSIKVVEIKGDEKEDLLGPMQSNAAERERQEEEEKKNNQRGSGKKKGRGCKNIRNRKKKKQSKRRRNNKGNPKKGNKPQSPPKYQPVKNIRLEVCTRWEKPSVYARCLPFLDLSFCLTQALGRFSIELSKVILNCFAYRHCPIMKVVIFWFAIQATSFSIRKTQSKASPNISFLALQASCVY